MDERLDRSLLAELESIMEGEFAALLEAYLRDSQERLFDVSRAWDSGDLELLRRSAHSLKGSSSNVGAVELARRCESVEHLARDRRTAQIPAALAEVRAELQEVREALSALCRGA